MTSSDPPLLALAHLDDLWFQVGGTICNLQCTHCFISCSPHNRSFGFLSLEEVRARLVEAAALGVKEYYFTGGEPFLHPQIVSILAAALAYGPATVLTNGTVFREDRLAELRAVEEKSLYSLEFRVSLDGVSPETNDPVRGEGSFARTLSGVTQLVAHGFLPIITAARIWPEDQDRQVVTEFLALLKNAGYSRPRLKLLPRLRLGAEETRTSGYHPLELVTGEMLEGYDRSQLVCDHARMVSDRGVHVCPILIESPDALLGQSLADSIVPYRLAHGACFTCYQYGAICSNSTSASKGPE